MPPRFKKKIRKLRGQKWHYGGKKKHRGGGSRGGRGQSGYRKHKKTATNAGLRAPPGYKGFHSATRKEPRAINLHEVIKIAKKKSTKEIDLKSMGYTKLLSDGDLREALTITVPSASAGAKEKVASVGGKLILDDVEESLKVDQNELGAEEFDEDEAEPKRIESDDSGNLEEKEDKEDEDEE